MFKIIEYPFGKVSIYSDYMIAVMNEGVTVSPNLHDILENLAKKHFAGKKFVYITHRINSYAVDPNVYLKTSKIPNLVGFAIVSGKTIAIDNSDFESMFLKKPLKSFTDLQDAIDWAEDLCKP